MTGRGRPLPRVLPLGDGAVTVVLGDRVDSTLGASVRAAAERVRSAALPAVREVVPAYAALTVFYEPLYTGFAEMADTLRALVDGVELPAPAAGRAHHIPVRYDGPDLAQVAEHAGLTTDEVVARHAAPWYEVALLGFVPGFAYLTGLDPALATPRRETPRPRVPAGSVAIGGAQTAVYPLATPGGWQLVGRTDVVLFDPARAEPALLQIGDRVRFEPVPGGG